MWPPLHAWATEVVRKRRQAHVAVEAAGAEGTRKGPPGGGPACRPAWRSRPLTDPHPARAHHPRQLRARMGAASDNRYYVNFRQSSKRYNISLL